MRCAILTLFPGAIRPYLDESILGIAQAQGQLRVDLVDFRNYAYDQHRTVDDRPYGGGPGMVLKPEPIFEAVSVVERTHGPFHKVLLCPRGRTFDQSKAKELCRVERLMFLCGRYEGFDERIRNNHTWDEISLGDFVLAGGELAALCVLEAAVRLIPGVLGCAESAVQESFETDLLDYPQYTRPREYRGMSIPDVLLSGDHAAVARWRAEQARRLTAQKLTAQNPNAQNPTADDPQADSRQADSRQADSPQADSPQADSPQALARDRRQPPSAEQIPPAERDPE